MAAIANNAVGLGLRQQFLSTLIDQDHSGIDFLEIAPENWLNTGGKRYRLLETYLEKFPFVLHGLCLSIGGTAPLNHGLLNSIKAFMQRYEISIYSDHLSYGGDEQGYLYELLPLPFTKEAIRHVVTRICQVQDILERPIAIENPSYYAVPSRQMPEIEFINAVVTESRCHLLLDVNNVYVNSINHGYNPYDFIAQLPTDKLVYLHIGGHLKQQNDLIIDTHGENVIDEVWQLLAYTYRRHGVMPTLLERDFNLPPLATLLQETRKIKTLQRQAMATCHPRKLKSKSPVYAS